MMRSIGSTLGVILAIGTYAAFAQLLNTEACNAAAKSYEPVARILAQILLVCV